MVELLEKFGFVWLPIHTREQHRDVLALPDEAWSKELQINLTAVQVGNGQVQVQVSSL